MADDKKEAVEKVAKLKTSAKDVEQTFAKDKGYFSTLMKDGKFSVVDHLGNVEGEVLKDSAIYNAAEKHLSKDLKEGAKLAEGAVEQHIKKLRAEVVNNASALKDLTRENEFAKIGLESGHTMGLNLPKTGMVEATSDGHFIYNSVFGKGAVAAEKKTTELLGKLGADNKKAVEGLVSDLGKEHAARKEALKAFQDLKKQGSAVEADTLKTAEETLKKATQSVKDKIALLQGDKTKDAVGKIVKGKNIKGNADYISIAKEAKTSRLDAVAKAKEEIKTGLGDTAKTVAEAADKSFNETKKSISDVYNKNVVPKLNDLASNLSVGAKAKSFWNGMGTGGKVGVVAAGVIGATAVITLGVKMVKGKNKSKDVELERAGAAQAAAMGQSAQGMAY